MSEWVVDVGGSLLVADGDGVPAPLRPKERTLVAAIALAHPATSSVADLTELVWTDPPATARKSVHNHIARVRRCAGGLVETSEDGYRLGDSVRVVAPTSDDVFRDLVDHPTVAIARTRYRDARLADEERAAATRLDRRPDDEAIALLVELADAEPHRFERWRLAVLALARRGLRRDALHRIRDARQAVTASDHVRRLERLERAVLDDDPRLDVDEFLRVPADSTPPDPFDPDDRSEEHDLFVDSGGVLAEVLSRIDDGETGCTLVTGPAGSGKTTLCKQAREHATVVGWQTHRVAARSHASADSGVVNALTRSLEERPGGGTHPTVDPLADTLKSNEELARCLHLMTDDHRRRLIIVDDLHHAATDEVASIARLVEATADRGHVAWIVASRTEHDLGRAATLQMTRWDANAVGRLLTRFVTPSPWLDGAADWIADESGGNPLAARELIIDTVRRRRDMTDDDGGFVPRRSREPIEWIRRRIARLDPAARRALGGASMVGHEFGLASLTPFCDDALAVIAQARLDGIIVAVPGERRRFTFAHDVFRDELLATLDEATRSRLALIALRDPIFDDDAHSRRRSMLARLAVHDDPLLAVTATTEAAALEVERQNPIEAERLYRRALELIERHADRNEPFWDLAWIEASLSSGSLAVSNGRTDAIDILLECARAAARIDRGDLAAHAVYQASRVGPASTVGRTDAAIAEAVESCRALPLTLADQARLDVTEMGLYGIATDSHRAQHLLDSALRRATEAADPELQAIVQRSAYMAVLRPGDLPRRREIAADLHRAARELDDLTFLYEAHRLDFSIAVEAGERDPRPILGELEVLHARFGERSRNWGLFSFQTTVAYLDGDADRVQDGIDAILSPETVASTELKLSTAGGHQIGMHLLRGDVASLDPMMAELEVVTSTLPAWIAARAFTAAAAGNEEVARDRLARTIVVDGPRTTVVVPDDFTGLPTAFLVGEAARLVDDRIVLDAAAASLRPFSGLWLWHGTGTFGPVDLALGRWAEATGDRDAATEHARRALVSTTTVGAPHLASQAAMLLARSDSSDTSAR